MSYFALTVSYDQMEVNENNTEFSFPIFNSVVDCKLILDKPLSTELHGDYQTGVLEYLPEGSTGLHHQIPCKVCLLWDDLKRYDGLEIDLLGEYSGE